MVLCWLFCKDKAMRTQIHRVGAEKGHNGIFLFAFGRFTQSQTHPSPKGNAKASDWLIFLIQGQKGLPGSPFLLHPNATYVNCGWGEGRSSWNSRYPPAPGSRYACLSRAVPAPVQSKAWSRWDLTQEPKEQDLQGTTPTLWTKTEEEDSWRTQRWTLSSLPKRGSQDPNFCFTLSSCDQSMKRYQTSTAKNKYASNSCVRGLCSKGLVLKTSHKTYKTRYTNKQQNKLLDEFWLSLHCQLGEEEDGITSIFPGPWGEARLCSKSVLLASLAAQQMCIFSQVHIKLSWAAKGVLLAWSAMQFSHFNNNLVTHPSH